MRRREVIRTLISSRSLCRHKVALGKRASGFGDTEVTTTGLAFEGSGNLPAISVAGESKFPTDATTLIGTGEYDYIGYLVGGREFGNCDTHASVGYQIAGLPEGVNAQDVWNFAVAVSYHNNPRFDVYAEALRHTSPVGEGELPDGLTPNLSAAAVPDGGDGFGIGGGGIVRK